MSWRVGDDTAERMAIAQLYGLGVGTQEEIAKAFMVHVNSVANYVSIFKLEGSDGLRSEPRGPKSWKSCCGRARKDFVDCDQRRGSRVCGDSRTAGKAVESESEY